MPPANESAPNNVWGTSAPSTQTEFLTLPSGQTAYANRLGMEGLLMAGVLGQADSLTAYVGKEHVQRVRGAKGQPDGEKVNASSVMRDPEALRSIVKLVDMATPHIVSNPVVHLHFTVRDDDTTLIIPMAERDKALIYTDQISFDDKMFLFNFAIGGTRDLQRFREESAAAVAGVEDVPGVPRPPVRLSRSERRKQHQSKQQ